MVFVVFACLVGNTFAQDLTGLSEGVLHGSDEEKRTVLLQLRNLRSEQASRAAVPALRDSSESVRATAAASVIYLPKEEAFTALSPLLADKNEFVRREGASALGRVQNPAAISLLIQLYQQESQNKKNKKNKFPEVKNACIAALGEIGDAEALDFLIQLLQRRPNDTNEFERRSAARAVGQIAQFIQTGQIKVVTPLSSSPLELKIIETAKYSNLSEQFPAFRQAVSVLTQILQTDNEADDTKRESAFALGAIGDANAAGILQANLNAKDNYLAEISREALRKLNNKIQSPEN